MGKANRTRNQAITVRMTTEELRDIAEKIKESGLSQQAYIISAARGAVISPSEEIDEIKKTGNILADFDRQLRGLGTNVNQMAHVANGQGALPTEKTLIELSDQIKSYKKENEKIWQSIRSLITKLTATGR